MTILEQGDGIIHEVTSYRFAKNPDDGLVFFAECGVADGWPYNSIRNVENAWVNCPECVEIRVATLDTSPYRAKL